MLTAKQNELLCFIDHVQRTTGFSPSFREMMDALDLNSTAGVHRLVNGLCERGHLRRMPNRARALEVLKRATGPDWETRKGIAPTSGDDAGSPVPATTCSATPVRVLDSIVDGERSWRSGPGSVVSVPSFMIGQGDHFVVLMADDAMVDEGILPGDSVLIRTDASGVDGGITLVDVDGCGLLIRRWNREGSMIRLDPANRAYDPQRFRPEAVRAHGRIAGVIRTYD